MLVARLMSSTTTSLSFFFPLTQGSDSSTSMMYPSVPSDSTGKSTHFLDVTTFYSNMLIYSSNNCCITGAMNETYMSNYSTGNMASSFKLAKYVFL